MATQSQIEANRKNAQHSTGPRTEDGKARSRKNATRHNLCSGVALQSDEDKEEFELLHADLREEHHPEGPTQDIFVYKMAEHFWFSWRASILLAHFLNLNMNEDQAKQVALFLRYHTTADRGFLTNLTALRKLQKESRLEEIGFVSQTAAAQPEAPPNQPATPPNQPATEPQKTDTLSPIVLNRGEKGSVVLSYVSPNEADVRKSVEKWLERKGEKVA